MKNFRFTQITSGYGIIIVLLSFILLLMNSQISYAATCSITSDETINTTYISDNSCTAITIAGDLTIIWDGTDPSDSTMKVPIDLSGGTFTVSSGTVTFSGPAVLGNSDTLTISSGATVTHTSEDPIGVAITVGTLNVEGSIDVTGMGCGGGTGNIRTPQDGEGPDTTSGTCTTSTSGYGIRSGRGAGHGAQGGGIAGDTESGGIEYDDEEMPSLLGSGGGGGKYTSDDGSAGGGIIRFQVHNTLTLSGSIVADATQLDPDDYSSCFTKSGGGGSGGTIYIHAGQIDGSGTMTAKGSPGTACAYDVYGLNKCGGGGAGGRVAIYYGSSGSFDTGTIDVSGGVGGNKYRCRAGTLQSSGHSGSDGTTYVEQACSSNSDCTPYGCDPGTHTCSESCTGNGECDTANAYICDTDASACIAGTACSDASACDGYACDGGLGLCMISCTSDEMCDVPSTYTCNVDGDCEIGATTCGSDSDCSGYDCRTVSATGTDHCMTSCGADTDCNFGEGYTCSGGTCTLRSDYCDSHDDCTPYGCDFGPSTCKSSCTSDLDCNFGSGAYCDTTNSICTEGTPCTTAADCGGYRCGMGTSTCMRSCNHDTSNPDAECFTQAGYSCDTDSSSATYNTCVLGLVGDGTACSTNRDCKDYGGYRCDVYRSLCYTSCESDTQCRSGGRTSPYSCVLGACTR